MSNFSMSISPEKKSSLEFLYGSLGMTLAEAVNIFFEKSLAVGGIPFDAPVPAYNRETLEAMRETMDIEAGKIPARRYRTVEELFSEPGPVA